MAEILGEDEDLLWDLVCDMEPEDGVVWLHDTNNVETIAFTDSGVENLRELIRELKQSRRSSLPE